MGDFIMEEPTAIELVPIVTAVCTNHNPSERLVKSLMDKYWCVLEEHVGNLGDENTALNEDLVPFLNLLQSTITDEYLITEKLLPILTKLLKHDIFIKCKEICSRLKGDCRRAVSSYIVEPLMDVIITKLAKSENNTDDVINHLHDVICTVDKSDSHVRETVRKKWNTFVKNCLKHGFNNTTMHSLLTLLLDVVYYDVITDDVIPISHIHGMLKSHSAFLPTMLSLANEDLKASLTGFMLSLLKTATTKSTSSISSWLGEKDFLFLLASYRASLAQSDQNILKIMIHYESCGVRSDQFAPYLWSKTALEAYKAQKDSSESLFKKPAP